MAETPRDTMARGGTANERIIGPGPAPAREGDLPRQPPPERGSATEASAGSREAQTRYLHDHGRYRDKIPVPDPATTPLGTDSEASGFRAGEGSMEPTSPVGGPAPENHRPSGHARGDVPGTPKILGMTALVAIAIIVVAGIVLALAL